MAEQVPSASQGQAALSRGTADVHPGHHGRPTSWVTSCTIIVGFIVGGIALVTGPAWWLFWIGVGIVVLGALFGAANHIMDDWYKKPFFRTAFRSLAAKMSSHAVTLPPCARMFPHPS